MLAPLTCSQRGAVHTPVCLLVPSGSRQAAQLQGLVSRLRGSDCATGRLAPRHLRRDSGGALYSDAACRTDDKRPASTLCVSQPNVSIRWVQDGITFSQSIQQLFRSQSIRRRPRTIPPLLAAPSPRRDATPGAGARLAERQPLAGVCQPVDVGERLWALGILHLQDQPGRTGLLPTRHQRQRGKPSGCVELHAPVARATTATLAP